MIGKETIVSKILDLHPGTLEVFLRVSPHFSKLKNYFLRKTLARRVTVEQAARIGGADLNQLLNELNEKAGYKMDKYQEKAPEERRNITETPPPSGNKEVLLDVRPTIESGKDPFQIIMNTVKDMKENQTLHLINSFEPIPLYAVMKGKGFLHYTEKKGGKYHVRFWRVDTQELSDNSPDITDAEINSGEGTMMELDVRGLEPPEPMVKILETLNNMKGTKPLLVHHHREPMLLYDKLEELGYEAATEKIDDNYYKVLIKKK